MKMQRIILPLLLIACLAASWAYHLYDKNTYQYSGGVSAVVLQEKVNQLNRRLQYQDSLHKLQLDSMRIRIAASEQRADSLLHQIDSIRSKHNAFFIE